MEEKKLMPVNNNGGAKESKVLTIIGEQDEEMKYDGSNEGGAAGTKGREAAAQLNIDVTRFRDNANAAADVGAEQDRVAEEMSPYDKE